MRDDLPRIGRHRMIASRETSARMSPGLIGCQRIPYQMRPSASCPIRLLFHCRGSCPSPTLSPTALRAETESAELREH